MRVSVVIPNWNGLRFLPPLFEDLEAQTEPPSEVIVVDNGSVDGSADWCEGHGAKVIRLDTNRGFAVAVNRGVRAASSELVAILNNDLRLANDWIGAISRGLGRQSFACGKVLTLADPSRIDAAWDLVSVGGAALRCGNGEPDGPEWNVSREIQFAPFTAVLVRKTSYEDVGGLDEAFESYLEDVDFGLRCASKGHTGAYVPDAVARHAGSGTLGAWHPRIVRQISRNQLFLVARHLPSKKSLRCGWKIAIAQGLWGGLAARRGHFGAWLGGKLEGIRRFRELRTGGSHAALGAMLESEREIRRRQIHQTYWRWYFRLTGI